MNLFQWPGIHLGRARDDVDIFDTGTNFNPDPRSNFLCPLITYAFHCLIVDPDATCTKALTPSLSTMTGEDKYGLEALFGMMMPDPAGIGKLVPMFSWEFLATLSVFVAMSPWYSYRVSPGTQQRGFILGDPRLADQWYQAKLKFYGTFTREQVARALKVHLTRFYDDCPEAWVEVLKIRGGGAPAADSAGAALGGAEPIDEAPPGLD